MVGARVGEGRGSIYEGKVDGSVSKEGGEEGE